MSDQKVIKQGYLSKESHDVFKRWDNRWFVLRDDHTLSYYHHKDSSDAKITLLIDSNSIVHKVPHTKKQLYKFYVQTKNHVLFLNAPDASTYDSWLEELHKIAPERNNSRPYVQSFYHTPSGRIVEDQAISEENTNTPEINNAQEVSNTPVVLTPEEARNIKILTCKQMMTAWEENDVNGYSNCVTPGKLL